MSFQTLFRSEFLRENPLAVQTCHAGCSPILQAASWSIPGRFRFPYAHPTQRTPQFNPEIDHGVQNSISWTSATTEAKADVSSPKVASHLSGIFPLQRCPKSRPECGKLDGIPRSPRISSTCLAHEVSPLNQSAQTLSKLPSHTLPNLDMCSS
ncbi:hypothetical protein M011DRAFT_464781 [Sporormia fimetaria CBS 119925]|uniref:Uncharacterized protein n=1 Tax=Sporormia fimetaria CBS 119925 TaxID=1340428 RepID=A0A6A6VMF4_9PLEO|nr:hypothetical protein M011DRAFT_464781 [Sporormia fimetaria CBS 119925]